MAGSASNWFKSTSGPLKGRTVYLTRDQQAEILRGGIRGRLAGTPAGRDLIARTLSAEVATNVPTPAIQRAALRVAGQAQMPRGAAGRGRAASESSSR